MEKEKKRSWLETIKKKTKMLLKGDKKTKLIIAIAFAGVILIMLSECKNNKTEFASKQTSDQSESIGDYVLKLETKIKDAVEMIEGAGNAKVLITLDKDRETVFAQTQKINTDYQKDFNNGEEKKVQGKDNTEKDYIIVENENGKKTALVQTILEPTIKGVIVICDGGGNAGVQQKVTECVATALGTSWNKVSVCKKAK